MAGGCRLRTFSRIVVVGVVCVRAAMQQLEHRAAPVSVAPSLALQHEQERQALLENLRQTPTPLQSPSLTALRPASPSPREACACSASGSSTITARPQSARVHPPTLQRGPSSRPHSARSVLEAGPEREPDPSLDFVRLRQQRRQQEAALRDAAPTVLSTQASCGSFVPSEPPVALNGPHAVRLSTRQRKPRPFKTTPSALWPLVRAYFSM